MNKLKKHTTVKELPESERPYEKFLSMGASALSDADLLSIILKSGTRDSSSLEIAQQLLTGCHGNLLNLYDLTYEQLIAFPGIGKVKALQLKAVAELSRRIASTRSGYSLDLKEPSTVAAHYMERMRHLPEEHLVCAYFDSRCHLLGDDELSVGDVRHSLVTPRELFMKALDRHAVLLVLLHNHPGGDPSPSEDDIAATHRIAEGAALIGLTLIDHIIIGDNCYFSFSEARMLQQT